MDDGLELAAKVGIPVPDGDTAKLATAADTWAALSTHESVTAVGTELERAAVLFEQVTSPDASFIDEDVRELKTVAADLAGAYGEIAQSCRDQKQAHDDLRDRLKELLHDLAEELAIEVAVSATIAVVASFVSFGVGAAAVAAKATASVARIVHKFADLIKIAVKAAKLRTVATVTRITAKTKQTVARIKDLTIKLVQKIRGTGVPKRPDSVPEGWEVRRADNGKGWVWQKPGSSGNANTVRDAEPNARYPHGYVRFYNEHGQPIDLNGKPGSKADTHIPKNPDGTYPTPKGWK